jgi:hypothetical protein
MTPAELKTRLLKMAHAYKGKKAKNIELEE